MRYRTLSNVILSLYIYLCIACILVMALTSENHAPYHITFRVALSICAMLAILRHGDEDYEFYLKLFVPVLIMICYVSFCWIESFTNFKWILTTILDLVCWSMVNGLLYRENGDDEMIEEETRRLPSSRNSTRITAEILSSDSVDLEPKGSCLDMTQHVTMVESQ